MAIEEKILLQVEQAQAATSIKELRDSVRSLRQTVSEATIGSEEYRVASEGLKAAQNALANATKLGTKETKLAGDSYNALSRTMAELKQQYHATTDEMKRKELAKEINAINDRLKAMDSDVGVFARNVGNYADGVAKGFSAMGGAAGSMINPIQGVNAGFQVLSKTPVIAIIGILINLFAKAYEAMKSSEEGSQQLAKAFDAFKVVGDLLTKGLQLLGKAFVWVGDGITTLFKKFGLLKEQSEERIELGQAEIELAKEQRRVTMENADAELEISKLRAAAADKINNSASERLELLKQAGELEKKTYENNYNLAKQEYELIKAKNDLLPSSSQDMQEVADAYAAMVNAETAYFNKQREYNSQMAKAFNQAKAQAKELKEEIVDLDRELVATAEDFAYLEEVALAREDFEKDFVEGLKQLADTSVEYEKKQSEKKIKIAEDEANAKEALQEHLLAFASDIAKSGAKLIGEQTVVGKALAISAATIDTYKAATSAYASMAGIPIVGPALGAAAAAAAVMSGLANVKAILATKTDGKSTSMPAVGATMMTAAPAVIQQVPVMRSLTGASEEERLNAIADNTGQTASRPIKAYVVQSEMEGEQLYAETREKESSF